MALFVVFDSLSARARRGAMAASEPVAAAVAAAVLRRYASLPKNGKPQAGEYTLLAGFALTDDRDPSAPPRVVALGTGTKCLPAHSRCARGEALADTHAEIVARRALVRFFHRELHRLARDVTSDDAPDAAAAPPPSSSPPVGVFEWIDPPPSSPGAPPVRLRAGVRVHMYATQSPCGDASVFAPPPPPGGGVSDHLGAPSVVPPGATTTTSTRANPSKRAKTTGAAGGGAGWTGAKKLDPPSPAAGGVPPRADPEAGASAQALGAARLKPGRGAETACMSCSDKICRWVLVGAQGGPLTNLLAEPVRLASVTAARPEGRGGPEGEEGGGGIAVGGGGGGEEDGGEEGVFAAGGEKKEGAFAAGVIRVGSGSDSSAAGAAAAAASAPHASALRRALVLRAAAAHASAALSPPYATFAPPALFTAPPPPPELSSDAGTARGWVACAASLNWFEDEDEGRREAVPFAFAPSSPRAEVVLGATGLRAGFTRKSLSDAETRRKAASRLSRAALAAGFLDVRDAIARAAERRTERARRSASARAGGRDDEKTRDGAAALGGDLLDDPRAVVPFRPRPSEGHRGSASYSYARLKEEASGYRRAVAATLGAASPLAAWRRKDGAEAGVDFPVRRER